MQITRAHSQEQTGTVAEGDQSGSGTAIGHAVRGITRRQFAQIAGLGLASMVLAACGKSETTDTAAAPAQATQPAVATTAATTTSAAGSDPDFRMVISSELTDLSGKTYALEQDDAKFVGRFSEGLAAISWTTSEYDAEWDTTHDEKFHVGCVDKTGKLVVNFDTAFSTISSNVTALSHEVYYHDGLIVLNAYTAEDSGLGGNTTFVCDKQGNVVFSTGKEGTHPDLGNFSRPYMYGQFVTSSPEGTAFLDGKGNVTSNGRRVPDDLGEMGYTAINVFGKDLYDIYRNSDNGGAFGRVYDTSGNVVFDVTQGIEGYDKATVISDACDGIVCLMCTKKNPYTDSKGGDKSYYGLYDVTAKSWVLGPLQHKMDSTVGIDGVISFRLLDFTGTEAEKDKDPYPGGGNGLVSKSGKVLLKPAKDRDFLNYVADGYWSCNDAEGMHLMYVEGDELVDIPLTSEPLSRFYPDYYGPVEAL